MRGVPQIEVTFDIDSNGILSVGAKDKGTGKQQSIRIEASTGLSQEEIDKMRAEAKANEDSDKVAKESVEKLNQADSLIFQTEKQIKEYGDKIPADKKEAIESALAELKTAHAGQNIPAIDAAMEKLNTVFQAASQDIYNAQSNAGAEGTETGNPGAETEGSADAAEDVEFEEVDDKK
jgi:molecular chaperone DnaK